MENERLINELSQLLDIKLQVLAEKSDDSNCFLPVKEIYKLKETMQEVKEDIAELRKETYEMECLTGKLKDEYKNDMTHMVPLRIWNLSSGQSYINSKVKYLEEKITDMSKQVERIVVPMA